MKHLQHEIFHPTNVTDLTVSPSKIEDGGKTTVKMTFDDKNGKIQNGDTIKVA